MGIEFSEVDFAEDVKNFVSSSSDVSFANEDDKKFIFDSQDSELLLVEKTIASPIKIIGVKKVDEDLINKDL